MTRIIYTLANAEDDAGLRSLLRQHPMPGSLSLTYEREPDYFIGAALDGDFVQTYIGRDAESGQVYGMGSRAVRQMYLNGTISPVGYMSHLRADACPGWGLSFTRRIARGYQFCREIHLQDQRTPFYLMSVIADNLPAQKFLTAQIPGMPLAQPYARLYTYAIAPRRQKADLPLPRRLQLLRGSANHAPQIIDCLQRNGARYQFVPHWHASNLFSAVHTPDLHPADFFLALDGEKVVGCLALWDQSRYKQAVVRGYHGALKRWRWLINLAARFVDIPYLPPVDSQIHFCFASHLAVDQDDRQVFACLLRAVYNETARRGFNYFLVGLSESNPFRPVVTKNYLHVAYTSQLYLVAWEDGLEAIARLDDRVPAPEIAVM